VTGDELLETLRRFFGEVATLSLATVDPSGQPHAANVNFVADERLNLLFVSHPDSAHARHIDREASAAVTAYGPFKHPGEIRGVQARCRAQACPESEFENCWNRFTRRFAYAREYEQRARLERFYRLEPTWLRWIDNRVGFGFKHETDWPVPEFQA